MKYFQVIETSKELLNEALASDIGDFEDAVIEASANSKKAEYIVTRNIKDFRKSLVRAITPEEMLVLYKL